MSALLIALVALPAVAGAGLALAGRRADRLAPAAGIGVAAVVLVLAVRAGSSRAPALPPRLPGLALALGVDPTARLLLPTVAGVALLVLAFAAAQRMPDAARFHGLMLLFVGSVLLTLTAETLPALLAGWEVMGALSFALIGHDRSTTGADAGLTAFVTTHAADLGLYLAVGAAVAGGAGVGLDALALAPRPWLDLVVAGAIVAALGKAAQLPFTSWLSRAMVAPSPVSALLHSAAMVAMGGWLLLRIEPLIVATSWAGPALGWIGALTTVVLGVVALAQRDLKQLLAASTAAQLGVVVLAAGVHATAGGVLQLVAHAVVKALLFLGAGVWLASEGTRRLDRLAGIGRRSVATGALVTLAAFALAGLPPSPIQVAKDAVLAAALRQDPALFAVGLVGSALAAAYAARLVIVVWRRPFADPQSLGAPRSARRGVVQGAVLVVLGGAVVALAVVAPRGQDDRLVTLAAAAAGLAGIAFVLVRRARPPRLGHRWFRLEPRTLVLVVRPVQRTADALARFDDRFGAGVGTAAAGVRTAGTALARFDTAFARAVDGRGGRPTIGVAAGVQAAAALVRRTQSGSLQSYYLAGVALVAGLVVLAVAVR